MPAPREGARGNACCGQRPVLTIGSVFSGIGGLERGLERAGLGPTRWQVEQDPFCRSVLARHWPDAERFVDVEAENPLSPVDIICGGFPCQDISDAGTKAGITGKRSGLWFAFARVIGAVRPRFVVVENVAALRSRGLDVVLRDLAACGYDATWDCIPAEALGAPHRRDRLYLVAWRVPDADGRGLRNQPERGPGRAQEADSGHPVAIDVGAGMEDANGFGGGPGHGVPWDPWRASLADAGDGSREWPPGPDDMLAWGRLPVRAQPAFCRSTHGIPRRLDRLRSLGNSAVPAVAEVAGRVVLDIHRNGAP